MNKPEQEQGRVVVPEQSFSSRTRELPVPSSKAGSLVEALAAAAQNPHMDVAKVERLYAILKETRALEAEQAFNDAMARAQAKIVPIANNATNDHTKSRYAKLAQINRDVMPILAAEGLSISFDSYKPEFDKDGKPINPPREGWQRVIAIVSHGQHSRRHHLDGPPDAAGAQGNRNKTDIQAMGSTTSYLRRYLVCMICNVATFDDDDGNATTGNGSGGQVDEGKLANQIKAIDSAKDEATLKTLFGKAWNEADAAKDKTAQRLLTQHKDARRKALQAGR